MASLLETGLSNALVATLLAAIAALAARLRITPGIVHALWLLVLVKLVTPPLVEIPVAWWPPGSVAPEAARADLIYTLVLVAAAVWIGGACAWYFRQFIAAFKFARLLRVSPQSAGDLQRQTDVLAREMGLRRAPRVLLVSAVVSPMLWGLGSLARLLFPLKLLNRIDQQARGTLLAHELAHFARGDHWVRLLEFVVEGLYWWNPLVAWARQGLENAEEECCDDMVVDHYAGNARRYAEALLDTIDFLADAPGRVPPVACCLGQGAALRQRLTRIMNDRATRSLTRPQRWLLLGAALAVLSWSPRLSATAGLELTVVRGSTTPVLGNLGAGPAGTNPAGAAPLSSAIAGTQAPGSVRSHTWLPVLSMQFVVSPDRRHSLRRSADGRVDLIDVLSGRRTDLSEFEPITVAFAPDGRSFAASCTDGFVRQWSCETREVVTAFDLGEEVVASIAFMPDGQRLVTADADGLVQLWDLREQRMVARLAEYKVGVQSVALSPDGALMAVALGADPFDRYLSGQVILYDMVCMEPFEQINCRATVGVLGFTNDGGQLLTGEHDGLWTVWDVDQCQPVSSVMLRPESIESTRFASSEPALSRIKYLATSSRQLSCADASSTTGGSFSGGAQDGFQISPQAKQNSAAPAARFQ